MREMKHLAERRVFILIASFSLASRVPLGSHSRTSVTIVKNVKHRHAIVDADSHAWVWDVPQGERACLDTQALGVIPALSK